MDNRSAVFNVLIALLVSFGMTVVAVVCWMELFYGYSMYLELGGLEIIPLIAYSAVRIDQHKRLKIGCGKWHDIVQAIILCIPFAVTLATFDAADIYNVFNYGKDILSQIRRLLEVAFLTIAPLSYFCEWWIQKGRMK